MKELYEKVYIKTAEDLPKKDNPFLLAHFKKGNDTEEFTFGWYPYRANMKELWLKNIDWYFQPVAPEADQPHKSAEERISNDIFEIIETRIAYFKDKYHKYEAIQLNEALQIIKNLIPPNEFEVIREYASQKTEIPEITDDEINRASEDDYNKTAYYSYQHAFSNGANWYREELKRRSAGTITTKDLKDIDQANDEYLNHWLKK